MGTKLEQFRAHKPRKTNYEKVLCCDKEKSTHLLLTGLKREALEGNPSSRFGATKIAFDPINLRATTASSSLLLFI